MLNKQRWSNLGNQLFLEGKKLLKKGQELFQFSKTQEIEAIQKQLQNLSPASQNTMQTLIQNSTLQKELKLPEKDALLAQIAAYAYVSPEQRPYQL